MACAITPGQKVLVLAEANAVEPQMVTVTPSGYRFTGRPWRAHVDPKCCVPLDDLREVLRLRAVRSLIRTSWPTDMMGEVNTAGYELARVDALLARLGGAS